MRTTINIDDDLMQKAMHAAGSNRKTDVIAKALQLLIEDAALNRVIDDAGSAPGIAKVFYEEVPGAFDRRHLRLG